MTTVTEQLKDVVAAKADKDEVETLISAKAAKVDTEMCLRWVDLLHKMVNQVMLLMTLKCKSDLEPIGGESNNVKQNRKVQLLHQSLLISKWIESFDSQNINDFYFQTNKEKSPEMVRAVQFQFKNALQEIESTKLSPNLKEINAALQATKERLDLTRRPEEQPLAQTTRQPFSTFGPKRLTLNPAQGTFSNFSSAEIMAEKNDRYATFAKTARTSASKKGHPPKLSPRSANRSVDPAARSSNYLDRLGKSPSNAEMPWGGTASRNFGGKKQSMPVGGSGSRGRAEDQVGRMTSKYSLQVDAQNEGGKPGKTTKNLKFKDDNTIDSPLARSNNSGDLLPVPVQMKSKLNDSSSKQLGFPKQRQAFEAGNSGKNTFEMSNADNAKLLPTGTSSTLPNIKSFYPS